LNWEAVVFWMFATMVVVPALFLVFARDIIHMAFWLLGALMGVSGLYLLMGADFLGMTQVFVYIGGINVLILFGIMLTNRDPVFLRGISRRPAKLPAIILVSMILAGLLSAIFATHWLEQPAEVEPTSAALGTFLMSEYILPFEMVSILLLVVLVGAAYIARRDGPGSRKVNDG